MKVTRFATQRERAFSFKNFATENKGNPRDLIIIQILRYSRQIFMGFTMVPIHIGEQNYGILVSPSL